MMFKKFSWRLTTLSKLCCCWSGLSGLTCLTLTLSQQRKLILNPQVTSSTRAGLKTSRNRNKFDAGFTHDPYDYFTRSVAAEKIKEGQKHNLYNDGCLSSHSFCEQRVCQRTKTHSRCHWLHRLRLAGTAEAPNVPPLLWQQQIRGRRLSAYTARVINAGLQEVHYPQKCSCRASVP